MGKTSRASAEGRWFRAVLLFLVFGGLSFIGPLARTRKPSDSRRLITRSATAEGEDFQELLKFMEKAELHDFQSKVLDWCQELGLAMTLRFGHCFSSTFACLKTTSGIPFEHLRMALVLASDVLIQEQGATSSEEVFENLEDLASDLGFSKQQVAAVT